MYIYTSIPTNCSRDGRDLLLFRGWYADSDEEYTILEIKLAAWFVCD
jgi:hypothetical protein